MPLFLGLFIDLENALSGVALDLASHSMLTNIIAGIFQGNLLGEGFLVAAAMLYLVLRIPGIVQRYAFRPMMDASAATAGAVGGAAAFAADVAPRLLALL